MAGLTSIDYGIIILYLAAMLGIGFYSMKISKNTEEFLVAGRRLGFPMFFGCMCAMCLGGGSTIGSTKLGYLNGLGGIWLNVSLGAGLLLTGFLISSKLAKLRALSLNEVFGTGYGKTARLFSVVLTLIYTITLTMVQVLAMGSILGGCFGITQIQALLIGGGIVMTYTFIGGMWSVTLTDIVQFVIKTVGILILAPIFCLYTVGGWDKLVSSVPARYMDIGSMGLDASLMYVFLYVPGILIGPDNWQRIFTAKNDVVSKNGTLWAGIYSFAYAFATVIIGMSVFVLMPNLQNPQQAFVTGVITFLPEGVRAIVLAAAMAATMSVSSGTILASSTVLYNDLYLPFINSNPSEKTSIWVNRILTAIVSCVVLVGALYVKDILVGIDISFAYLSGAICIPLTASFVLKKFSRKAGLFSLVAGALVVTVCFVPFGFNSVKPIAFGMLASLIVFCIVNKMDKNKITSQFEKKEEAV